MFHMTDVSHVEVQLMQTVNGHAQIADQVFGLSVEGTGDSTDGGHGM